MSAEEKLRWVIIVAGFLILADFLVIDPSQSLVPQVTYTAIGIGLQYLLLFFFAQRKNWARIVTWLFALLGLLSFPLAFVASHVLGAVVYVINGFFSTYLLVFLNRKEIKDLFCQASIQQPRSKKRRIITVLCVVGALLGIAGVSVTWLASWVFRQIAATDIWLEDVETGRTWAITQEGVNFAPQFSPDGQRIVYQHARKIPAVGAVIRLYTVATQQTQTLIDDGQTNLHPTWDPTGEHLIYASHTSGPQSERDLWMYVLSEGRKLRLTHDALPEYEPRWSPDGQWVLFSQQSEQGRSELFILPAGGGTKRQLTHTRNFLSAPAHPTWSPDATEIAYVSFNKLLVINLEGDVQQVIDLTGLSGFRSLAFSSTNTGRLLLLASSNDTGLEAAVYRISRQTRVVEPWRMKRSFIETGLSESPDGRLLVSARPSKQRL